MDVSIIIVNYNTRELLRNCLISIYEQTKDINFEVIVSDNGSIDDSIEMLKADFPQTIVVENKANLGFGAANNRGLDIAKGKYILYLNSDTILLNNAVKIFYDFWEDYPDQQALGAIGCNLVDVNHQIIHSYGKFPTVSSIINELIRLNYNLFIKTIFYLFKYDYLHLRSHTIFNKYVGEVEYISGADLFLKNDKTRRYDERFFLYYEETYLQYRLFCEGKKRILIDGPRIQHLGCGSINEEEDFYKIISFSNIQSFISSIVYLLIAKKKNSILIVKFLIIMILCNPYFIMKTYKHIKKILLLK